MLNTIGEHAVRTTTRADNNMVEVNKDVVLKKVEKAVEERPIERSQESAKPEPDAKNKSYGYNMDDEGVYYEKYDKNGNVIFRTPPEQKPIDEHA